MTELAKINSLDESAQVIYGQLKEGAHLTGYGRERVRANFNRLIQDKRFQELGFKTIDEFVRSLENSLAGDPWPIAERREFEREMDGAGARQSSIAQAFGLGASTVSDDLRDGREPATEEGEQASDQQEQESEVAQDGREPAEDESDNQDEEEKDDSEIVLEDEDVEETVIQEDDEETSEELPLEEKKKHWSVAEWGELTTEDRQLIFVSEPNDTSKFNQVNENIDWAKWSWNPITGCLHNCPYCYARDIANRFYEQKFEPSFLPSRLHAPRNTLLPAAANNNIGWRNVFVCSMADLFGKWVPQEWIDAVFDQVKSNPQWNFLFLTKFPIKLSEVDWPENAWCGTTVDYQWRVPNVEKAFSKFEAGVKWLSCEPMMERLTFSSLEMFDWVVIGAASASTQTSAFLPPLEWVEHLIQQAIEANCKVYIKPNLIPRLQEYPDKVVG